MIRTATGDARYEDAFQLRIWTERAIATALKNAGFGTPEEVTERFPELGARYFVARPV